MILYKYVSFASAIKIINESSLGFTCLEDLNDPLEGTNFGFCSSGDVTPQSATRAFKNNFSRRYAVLSLTRNPLNPLMWSHYGDAHKGAVIGIDVEIAGLMSEDEFTIPVHMGEMIYVATKNRGLNGVPTIQHLDEIKSNELKFKNEIRNYLKQAFLYKSLEWGYEEEVRVIKSISHFCHSYHKKCDEVLIQSTASSWKKVRNSVLGQPLYCFGIPREAIKEVYLGVNVNRNGSRSNEGKDEQWFKEQLTMIKAQNFTLYGCEADFSSWKLRSRLITS
ncbi:DUF2971 domain-containing protein [Vibrio cortegadensis]|uniref:DUF2971 domain-containing protein n=1 Tax=Vibrio cortegadensis TaxID=1328770 RepID=UPI0021C2E732|nr:DUF2971 domain-containing protein [Vibrio cortegadensis]MDN3699202.1 DUF2971 domain-containing protein [Vibrio cortegadensis]